ncbi:MAG: hypothetical protein IT518_09285 [Burkholderiales bacterium]|nr:hypothetical protein [Burkholderiales bacterium]
MSDKLLLKFRVKSTPYGVTRETLKALAAELDTTETMVIHLAISRFAKEVLPTYEADDGPLSPPYLAWLKETAKTRLPKGKVMSKKSLV